MKILADASLPAIDRVFLPPFELSTYQDEVELRKKLTGQDILVCRSTLKVNADLLAHSQLQILATASSGTDHVDKAALAARGIRLIDAKGANAPSVAHYIRACLTALEPNFSLANRQVGIIGLGAVGQAVAALFKQRQQSPLVYDPPRSLREPGFASASLAAMQACDLICIHAELHQDPPYPSYHLVNEEFLNSLRPGTILINAARGGIVDEAALLACENPIVYCTDVFQNEPNINPAIVARATLCTPHIAGHSQEGKVEAVYQISRALHELLNWPIGWTATKPDPGRSPVYDPMDDTRALKVASDLRECFLQRRRDHWRFEQN